MGWVATLQNLLPLEVVQVRPGRLSSFPAASSGHLESVALSHGTYKGLTYAFRQTFYVLLITQN